jgi:hypothetical protein
MEFRGKVLRNKSMGRIEAIRTKVGSNVRKEVEEHTGTKRSRKRKEINPVGHIR